MIDLEKYDQRWFKRGRNAFVVMLWYVVQHTLFRLSLHNMYGYRAFLLKLFGCKLGKNVCIRRTCEVTYPWNVDIGNNTWIDDEVLLYSLDKIKIGSNCSITRRSYLCTGNHDISDPCFGLIVKPITIKDGVWVQAECFIGQGVTIGACSVIGARSSVFRNMPDNMVCFGTPSKPVKKRIIRKIKKKILILGDYFYPDFASTGQLLTELCLALQDDFKITVLTSVPSASCENYSWKINYEKLENIDLVRIKTKPFDKSGRVSRIKHILEHYMICRKAIRQLERQDIVFTISQPPIMGGMLGVYAQKKHKAKFIYNIQDFNPEQAEAIGYFKIRPLLNMLRKIDSRTCNKADRILLVGHDMVETLRKRGIAFKNKTVLINNWVDEKKVYPLNDLNVLNFRKKYGFDDKLTFMYSGNIGLYYDLENIVRVMARFNMRKDVVFVLVGDGAKRKEIEDWVKNNDIDIVKFLPFQDKDELIFSLNAADIHLVSSHKGIKGVSVPSKIYGVMAAGKYVLGIVEKGSEASLLIEKSGCGTLVEPGDYEAIYSVFKNLMDSGIETIKNCGLKGRSYLEKNMGKSRAMQKYKELFETL